MYEYIKGQLIEATPQYAIIDVHGMGYRVTIPVNTLNRMPEAGKEVILFTFFYVRENTFALFGFLTRQEREMFELLISVTGVGPKMGITLLGHLSADQLAQAVRNGEVAVLCKVPGIGRKTAERLILETKDKITIINLIDSKEPEVFDLTTLKIRDAMSALINLGYSQAVASRAIKQTIQETADEMDLSSLITLALRRC